MTLKASVSGFQQHHFQQAVCNDFLRVIRNFCALLCATVGRLQKTNPVEKVSFKNWQLQPGAVETETVGNLQKTNPVEKVSFKSWQLQPGAVETETLSLLLE